MAGMVAQPSYDHPMSDTTTPAPPTVPGDVPLAGVPNSRLAIAAVFCGIAGLLLPLINIVAIVLGIVAIRRIIAARGRQQGHGLAIVGICVGVVGIAVNAFVGFMIWSITVAVTDQMVTFESPSPTRIHQSAVAFANRNGGKYPEHVAELVVDRMPSPVQISAVEVVPTTAGKMVVGEFDLVRHDGTSDADKNLRAALRTVDTSAPVYEFGDCWFVRLGEVRLNPDLIAGWSVNSTGNVQVTFDTGTGRFVTESEWDEIWAADAAQRVLLEMEPLTAPKWPTSQRVDG
jgi:hypothetical protein